MARPSLVTHAQRARILAADSTPAPALAAELGLSPGQVRRELARARRAEDYPAGKSEAVRPPPRRSRAWSWDLASIRGARDAQLRGDFERPVRLAEALRTDDALYTAYHHRLGAQNSIAAGLVAHPSARGEVLRNRAERGLTIPRSVLLGMHGTLVNHGLAVGYVTHTPTADGAAIDYALTEWPLEAVRWDDSRRCLVTRAEDTLETIPIVHGDGRWLIIRKFHEAPWTQEAALLPAALIWAAHAGGIRDWAAGSSSHGQAKIVGELPEGVSLKAADGSLTPEARAFLDMLIDMVSGEIGAGVRPSGAKTEFLANTSGAWQVFSELVSNRERAAARVYLGTDAILGAAGGAPGVDIAALFGVASAKLQGDLAAIEAAINSGLVDPWAAANVGTTQYAPRFRYEVPDPDAERVSEERHTSRERLLAAIERYRALGFVVDQGVVDDLARQYGVDPAPALEGAPAPAPAEGEA